MMLNKENKTYYLLNKTIELVDELENITLIKPSSIVDVAIRKLYEQVKKDGFLQVIDPKKDLEN